MRNNKIILLATFVIIIASSCSKKFDQYKVDPNRPLSVTPSLLLRSVLNDMPTLEDPGTLFPNSQEERECQYTCQNYQYYGNNQYWSGSASLNYGTLNNIVNMEAAAKLASSSSNTPYHALGKFLRAYIFVNMSLRVGDLPMSEALQGSANLTPKYDTQKQIFVQSLSLLDSANSMLASFIQNGFSEFSGDYFFAERLGNARSALIAWQKVVNTYRLRVLIELSKKTSDADLNVATQFSTIINNPTKYPILSSMNDNLQYLYNSSYNYYPNNADNFGNDALRLNMAATYLNYVASTNDLRAMMVAEPARGLGFNDTSFNSFVGAPTGQDLSTMTALVQQGKISLIGRHRYYETLTGEPTFLVGYPEMCLNIAEAINRGWLSGDAESWYKKGIQASQSFYGIADGSNTVTFQKFYGLSSTGTPILGLLGDDVSYAVNFNFAAFYAQPSIKYAGNNAAGLTQILWQKYAAMFRNSGMEAYFQWRRTGVPVFSQGSGVGNGGLIPLRYQYPSNEISTNSTNYSVSITSQYSGSDNINAAMWILK